MRKVFLEYYHQAKNTSFAITRGICHRIYVLIVTEFKRNLINRESEHQVQAEINIAKHLNVLPYKSLRLKKIVNYFLWELIIEGDRRYLTKACFLDRNVISLMMY